MGSVELRGVCVSRDGRSLLDAVDLVVADGERLVLLGPSGSGKTTLLRALAGLDEVTAGTIWIDGRDVTRWPPRERDVGMVNQQASLQPHLDVAGNVGFPLRIRRTPKPEIDTRVAAEARSFSFRDRLTRRPATLSAGEQHEVALARSLVRKVGLLLLDEPLARADAPRRAVLLRELIAVQEGYGVTLLCATNDQRVAMGLANRCAVLDGGRIVQVGRPDELFARPASTFVAGFLGTPPMNLLPGRVERGVGGARIVAGPLRIPSFAPAVSDLAGANCTVGVRPSDLHRATDADVVTIEEPVRATAFLGAEIEVRLGGADGELVAHLDRPTPEVGELIRLGIDPAAVHLFDTHGGAVAHGV